MLFENNIRINVYHILTVQGNAVSSLVSSVNSFREKPVQNAEMDVNRLGFLTVELQVYSVRQFSCVSMHWQI